MTRKPNPRQQTPRPTQTQSSFSPARRATTTFADHIGELKRRIAAVLGVFLVTSTLAYSYHEQLTKFIMQPLGGQKLIYLTPGGGFSFIFQISMYAGLLSIAPLIMYHIYGFIRPALPQNAQRSALKVILGAFLLMAAGVCYGYFVAVPSALHFLSTFAGADIVPNLTADSYLNFFLTYIVGLGILFELPLLLLFVHWTHPMTPGGLMKTQRGVILAAFIIAALITPTPDVFNQLMIAIPLIVIYQFGVVAVLITIYKQRRKRPSDAETIIKPPIPQRVLAAPVSQPARPATVHQPSFNKHVRPVAQPLVRSAARPRPHVAAPPVTRTAPGSRPTRRLSIDGVSVVS